MGLVARVDKYQKAHRLVGFPLAVVYKFVDDQGGYLAALVTYYAFLSLFPVLLLLVTALGFVLHGDATAQQTVLRSALSQFPIIGNELRTNVQGLHGSGAGLITGVLGSVYGSIGVAQAGQNAMNNIWAIPRHRRPNPIRSRMRSLAIVVVLGSGLIATTVVSALAASAKSFGHAIGLTGSILAFGVSLGGNAVLFLVGFRMLTIRRVSSRALVPGALGAAVGWQALQAVGVRYVGHTLKHASQVYGLFGVVLGLLGFLYLAALVTLLCAEANAVRARRLWPRSLLTPFTDNVQLTKADERSYEGLATTQTTKGFEQVHVTFDKRDST